MRVDVTRDSLRQARPPVCLRLPRPRLVGPTSLCPCVPSCAPATWGQGSVDILLPHSLHHFRDNNVFNQISL